jgi:hypothetical protein
MTTPSFSSVSSANEVSHLTATKELRSTTQAVESDSRALHLALDVALDLWAFGPIVLAGEMELDDTQLKTLGLT